MTRPPSTPCLLLNSLLTSSPTSSLASQCEELWVAEPGKVSVYKGEFEQYRRQQLKLTKKLGLLPPAAGQKVEPEEEAAAGSEATSRPRFE